MKNADWADWATAKSRGCKFYVGWMWGGLEEADGMDVCLSGKEARVLE